MTKRIAAFFPLFVSLLIIIFYSPTANAVGETLTVKVRQAQLRSTPSFTGKVVVSVPYGEHVEVLDERDAWKQVAARKGKGWVHESSLTDRYLVLKPGSEQLPQASTNREVAVAGKGLYDGAGARNAKTVGFGSGVENAFRKGNPAGYATLNTVGQKAFSPQNLLDFLAAGGITPAPEAMP